MENLPHRFHQFFPPTHGPHFDDPNPNRHWASILGHFIRPVVTQPQVTAFVFLYHNPHDIELRFAAQDYAVVEAFMAQLQQTLQIYSIPGQGPNNNSTVGDAYTENGDSRWLATNKNLDPALKRRRSTCIFRFLHAGCALALDTLEPDGNYFRFEPNNCPQNPLGNMFESQLHLISNFSMAQFDVDIFPGPSISTPWMPPTPVTGNKVRCRL